uniref:Cationic amino acid transporter C-terminal domain-containing protein n=1 Tax=Oryza brachyantha TaxID=4533 RepID=J3NBI2_ORYBR
MPVAGGAFSYLRVTFGELAAFLTGANLIMEYVFSNAAVARSFTAYLGTAVGVDAPSKWRIVVPGLPKGFNEVDLVAVGVILLITVCICYSTKESSSVNMALTAVHVAFILFVIVMGFWRGDARNLTTPADPGRNPGGFFPHGAAGVFNGAAMVYLSYIGYDAVSTMAEEVERPSRDIPVGVSGSVVLVTLLYCLMAASMSMLLPYDAFGPMAWSSGVFTAALALFTELDILLNLVCIGTLFVFYMVANAVVYRRYAAGPSSSRRTLAFLLAFSLAALCFTLLWKLAPHGGARTGLLVACGAVAVAAVGAFQVLVPQAHRPELWGVPAMPWVPAASVFLNVFLLGSLDRPSYVRFGFFTAAALLVYVLYSVHASYDAEEGGEAAALDGAKVLDDDCKV